VAIVRLAEINTAMQKPEKKTASEQVLQNADNIFVYPIILPTDQLADNRFFLGQSSAKECQFEG